MSVFADIGCGCRLDVSRMAIHLFAKLAIFFVPRNIVGKHLSFFPLWGGVSLVPPKHGTVWLCMRLVVQCVACCGWHGSLCVWAPWCVPSVVSVYVIIAFKAVLP